MMILNLFRRYSGMLAMGLLPALAIVWCVGFGAMGARAQGSQAWGERIDTLQGMIKNAETHHAGAAELGDLWLQLANRYQDLLQFAQAEDAFQRSLRLLREAGTQSEYADALDGMGSLDLAVGRLSEAKDWNKKALAIYESLGDRNRAGKMHETIALAELFDHRAKEAETDSAAGLAELRLAAQPDAGEVVAAHLTHSYAMCFQKRCAAALDEARQAMTLAQSKFPDESLEVVSSLSALGFGEWKTGAVAESDRSMVEALRLARGLSGLPEGIVTGAQFGVMRQYATFLKETHRRPEAAQMEAEMERLESAHPAGCSGCTVSVASLGFMH